MSLQGQIFRRFTAALPPALLRRFGQPAAVFFHGVEREVLDPDLQSNHHEIDRFISIASALKRDFDAAPIGELAGVLKRPEKHRRTVFLMSDDGYANTLSVAADVLKSFDLPWTLFVSTQHIDTGELHPMFLARLFLQHAPEGDHRIPEFNEPIKLNGARAAAARRALTQFRCFSAQTAQGAVKQMRALLEDNGLSSFASRYTSERFLDWDGVRALARRGVTIGAHAHWHWAMHANEDAEYLKRQAELPRQRIEAEVGPCRYFAYPFGNAGDVSATAWRAVRDAGYEFAFTTMSGALSSQQNRWLLPRYGLAPHETNLAARLPLLALGNRRLAKWQRTLH